MELIHQDFVTEHYYGIWNESRQQWAADTTGRLIWYPAVEIAKAHANKQNGRVDEAQKVTARCFGPDGSPSDV